MKCSSTKTGIQTEKMRFSGESTWKTGKEREKVRFVYKMPIKISAEREILRFVYKTPIKISAERKIVRFVYKTPIKIGVEREIARFVYKTPIKIVHKYSCTRGVRLRSVKNVPFWKLGFLKNRSNPYNFCSVHRRAKRTSASCSARRALPETLSNSKWKKIARFTRNVSMIWGATFKHPSTAFMRENLKNFYFRVR